MPSNNIKYSMQFKEQTVMQMLDKGVSAPSVAAEIGVNLNTVCKTYIDPKTSVLTGIFYCDTLSL